RSRCGGNEDGEIVSIRPRSRYAGHADPAHADAWRIARLRDRAAHREAVRQRAAGRTGITLSGAGTPAAQGLADLEVGPDANGPPRAILHDHGERPEAIGRGDHRLRSRDAG